MEMLNLWREESILHNPVQTFKSLRENGAGCRFSSTHTLEKIQRKLAWPLCEDDMQVCGAFHIKGRKKKEKKKVLGTLTLLVFFLVSSINAM